NIRSSSLATATPTAARRWRANGSSHAKGSRTTSPAKESRSSGSRHSTMSLLPFPEPYDFELSTSRFRVFGLDLANRLVDGVLHRVVDGREVLIAAATGGVEVEPLDSVTRPVVEHLLGAPFDLGAFYAWTAGEP